MTDDIETDQGCCGTEPAGSSIADDAGGGCGTESTDKDSSTIETDQGCCGSELDGGASSSCGGSTQETAGPTDVEIPSNEKSAAERARIRTAARLTTDLFADVQSAWAPDWTGTDVHGYLHERLETLDLEPAWDEKYCPSVHVGADANVGHTEPSDRTVPPGELLHVDFGVSFDGYAADLQRVYYHAPNPEATIPSELAGAFEDVRAALEAGRNALALGTPGHEVDAAARSELADRGWSDFNHAFGHQVGEDAHDGGVLLGPTSERYGERPFGTVTAGEVYSIELGVGTTFGYVGLEEMVEVTENGAQHLVAPQTELRRLPDSAATSIGIQ